MISGCYSDTLVEQEVGGTSVAEIFKHYGEGYFRDKEVSDEACDLTDLSICEICGYNLLLSTVFDVFLTECNVGSTVLLMIIFIEANIF